ncbi:MAG TPA: pilus assembly protein PilM, partial [Clostridiales bacterium UBA8960]|nr:pilus assembly protein PilM [Clostridiales bacterium UBA8960]
KNLVVRETIQYLEDCIEEIDKVFKYYTSRNAENKIDGVYIYGGGSQFTDLVELFNDRLEIPTKILSKIENVDFTMKMVPDKLTGYINALGALIRG